MWEMKIDLFFYIILMLYTVNLILKLLFELTELQNNFICYKLCVYYIKLMLKMETR